MISFRSTSVYIKFYHPKGIFISVKVTTMNYHPYSDSLPERCSKYGVISGPYFPAFSPNTGKYEPEITRYLDTSHVAIFILDISGYVNSYQKMIRQRIENI